MEIQGLAFLPCLWVTWTLTGLCVTYAVTIIEGHAPTYFLYISETGSYSPESVIFTTVFMLSSILGATTIYFQYKFLGVQSAANEIHSSVSQKALLTVGLSSCIGTSVVATFQVEPFPVIHRIGAVVSLGLGAVYNLYQSKYLYQMSLSRPYVCHIRMTLSRMMAGALISYITKQLPTEPDHPDVFFTAFFVLYTTVTFPLYVPLSVLILKITLIYELCNGSHCTEICDASAVIAEWLSVLTFLLHYLTYYTDFQHLYITWRCDKGGFVTLRRKIHNEEEISVFQ